jgi:hypothetical protein
MKKFLLAFVVSVLMCNAASFAQDSARVLNKNAVMVELGGNGILYSFSYERKFFSKNQNHLLGRIGYGIIPAIEPISFVFAEVNYLNGDDKEFLETGIGFTYDFHERNLHYHPSDGSHRDYKYYQYFFIYRLGYRYQSKKGFMFRAAATPIFIFEPSLIDDRVERFKRLKFYPWLGLTCGYSF